MRERLSIDPGSIRVAVPAILQVAFAYFIRIWCRSSSRVPLTSCALPESQGCVEWVAAGDLT
jgi:hypothetical protein